MKKFLIIFVILYISINLSSIENFELKTFLTDEDIIKIDKNKIIPRMYIKYNAKKENTDNIINIKKTKYNDEDFTKYEIICDEKGFIPYELTDESKLKLYNIFTSFTKLTGMNYYSRRAGKVLKFVKKSYRVKSLSGKKYSDNVYTEIKPNIENMFFQEDNKFGKLIYRSELYNEDDNFVLINTCLEPISKFIFQINNEEEFKIYSFYFYDKEKLGYYYYSFLVVKVSVDFILKNGLWGPTAFSNRLRASSVHLAKLIGLDWNDRLNAWKGKYDTY